MKKTILGLIAAGACIAAGTLLAQTAEGTLTIPVTGQVTDNGITYRFTGQVIFPKPAATISVIPGPDLFGLYDTAGNYLRTAPPGTPVSARGRDFGAVKGRAFWGVEELIITEWTDTSVKFTTPAGVVQPRGHLLSIHRPDGAATSDMVFSTFK